VLKLVSVFQAVEFFSSTTTSRQIIQSLNKFTHEFIQTESILVLEKHSQESVKSKVVMRVLQLFCVAILYFSFTFGQENYETKINFFGFNS
jgi:hypothetical protein